MACWAGFVAGRELARLIVPRRQGNIFFTGATATLRGGRGLRPSPAPNSGCVPSPSRWRANLAPRTSMSRIWSSIPGRTAWVRERREKLWGKEALDNPDLLMPPASVAASYWQLYQQPRSAWTFEPGSDRRGEGVSANKMRMANRAAIFAIRYSPFATHHHTTTGTKQCVFSWSGPARSADISAAGCSRPAPT